MRPARLPLILLLASTTHVCVGLPPVITNITMRGAAPQLSIVSSVGATNQIQSATNLLQASWSVLGTLVVTQSAYLFVDNASPVGPERFYRVVDLNATSTSIPPGMALVPAGGFEMGDTFYEGASYELPLHTVFVSAFYMDKFEVTKALWDRVLTWGATNGYGFDNPSSGKGPNHPVQSINWYDMVKWCNARSEMDGRIPAYYTDVARTQVYRMGQAEPDVNWNAGYRLPTEAEWEKADRAGVTGHRFPWSDVETISHSQANYYSDPSYSYDVSPTRGYNPAFVDGVMPYTSPVGSFAPNGYVFYDMAGNVWEWCWDWAGNYSTDPQTDPRGQPTGTTRVGRGGNWNFYAEHCRCSYRYGNSPTYTATNIGFRCAMTAR